MTFFSHYLLISLFRHSDPSTYRGVQHFSVFIDAFEKFASKELNAHYRENKPEHETDEEHVEYTGYCIHQRVHYDLRSREEKVLLSDVCAIRVLYVCRTYDFKRELFFSLLSIFTLMPCHLEIARNGLKARNVLSDRNTLRFSFSSIKRLNMDTCSKKV